MERKEKVTAKQKEKAVKDYLSGKYTLREVAKQYQVHHSNISKWIMLYQNWGEEGLKRPMHNRRYSDEFKEEVVQAYLTNNYSLYDLCRKYKLRNFSVIQSWVTKMQNQGRKL